MQNNFENASKLNEKIEQLQGKIYSENETSPQKKHFDRSNISYDNKVKQKLRRPQTGKPTRSNNTSSKKPRKLKRAWITNTESKSNTTYHRIDRSITQLDSEMEYSNVYKNMPNSKIRPTTAKTAKYSRKNRLRQSNKIANFDSNYQPSIEKYQSPQLSTSREEKLVVSNHMHHRSKLSEMKDLCHPQKRQNSIQDLNISKIKSLRPNSVDFRLHNKSTNESFQKHIVKNVELDMKEKHKVVTEVELRYLFEARWKDLDFPFNHEQYDRFKRYIQKNSFNGKLKLVNLGLSVNSAKAIHEIFNTNKLIKRVYLGRNKLQDTGAQIIALALQEADNLVHLDISSNLISPLGFKPIFDALYNNTIVSLDLSSTDRSCRNKLGVKGAEMLRDLLQWSKFIQFLNVSSTALMNNGIQILLEGIRDNDNIVSLIMQANEMTHVVIYDLIQAIISSGLQYLDISHNNIGNNGLIDFCTMFGFERCQIKILKMKNWGFDFIGATTLYKAIKYNRSVKELYIDQNKLSAPNFTDLRLCLWTNNSLKLLSMNSWKIGDKGAYAIGEGFMRNNTLTHLYLINNNIPDEAGKEIIWGLQYPRRCPIEVLDLSWNLIGDEAGKLLVRIYPKLDHPPKKLNLDHNLLKTHKYKLLKLFVNSKIKSVHVQRIKTQSLK
jgi:Ran GTPase-activating protein (RanGAP) involved in mRNA processing and transport